MKLLAPHVSRPALEAAWSDLLARGHSPEATLRLLARAAPGKGARIKRLLGALEQGQPLPSEPGLFTPEVEALFAAGQESGRLAETMGHARRLLGILQQASHKLLLSLLYPLLLLLALNLTSRALLKALASFGAAGEPTGVLGIFASDIYLAVIIGLVSLLLHWFVWSRRRGAGPSRIWGAAERLAASVPLLRSWLQRGALSSAAASLAATLGARLPLAQALSLAGRTSRSVLMRRGLERAAARVEGGQEVVAALEEQQLPRELRAAFGHAAAEDLPAALSTVADSAHQRLSLLAKNLTRATFALALLLAAACVGAMTLQVWMVINGGAGGIP